MKIIATLKVSCHTYVENMNNKVDQGYMYLVFTVSLPNMRYYQLCHALDWDINIPFPCSGKAIPLKLNISAIIVTNSRAGIIHSYPYRVNI